MSRGKPSWSSKQSTSGVLRGSILSMDSLSHVATVACSLEVRRHSNGELPLRGFFVAQNGGEAHLGTGKYRLRLEDGREEIVNIDQITPLTTGVRHLGSFEIMQES